MATLPPELARFAGQAAEAVSVLKSIAHEGRLLVLCYLSESGELSVGELVDRIGLSPSALSQHLAKLRAEGLVATRKSSQTVYYRIAEPRVLTLLATLHDLYCPALGRVEPSET
jgi:DNA-binding transcriptional ArsR family regulator